MSEFMACCCDRASVIAWRWSCWTRLTRRLISGLPVSWKWWKMIDVKVRPVLVSVRLIVTLWFSCIGLFSPFVELAMFSSLTTDDSSALPDSSVWKCYCGGTMPCLLHSQQHKCAVYTMLNKLVLISLLCCCLHSDHSMPFCFVPYSNWTCGFQLFHSTVKPLFRHSRWLDTGHIGQMSSSFIS